MKLKVRARLPRCLGGRHAAVVDSEQRAREMAEIADEVVRLGEDIREMSRAVAEIRQINDELGRAWEELELLFPDIFLHRSRWQRLKRAFRRSRATVAPGTLEDDDGSLEAAVQSMSPFLRNFLSMDE